MWISAASPQNGHFFRTASGIFLPLFPLVQEDLPAEIFVHLFLDIILAQMIVFREDVFTVDISPFIPFLFYRKFRKDFSRVLSVWAHPRAYGEYTESIQRDVAIVGSPPRVRGIYLSGRYVVKLVGLTPAHAGNIRCCRFDARSRGAHPRVYGEYAILDGLRIVVMGSPPRIRGISGKHHVLKLPMRLTPAYTGNILVF